MSAKDPSPKGWLSTIFLFISKVNCFEYSLYNGLLTIPGLMQFTRIFCLASSKDNDLEKPTKPDLDAEYMDNP